MGGLTAKSERWGLRLALAALMAIFALLAVPHPARATEIWAETWRDVHDAIALAETTDEQVYIRISRQFDRWEGDPDLVMHGGDVVINMDAFRINPRVAGQSVESGRIITLEGGRLTLQGLDRWSNGGFTGGSAELGGAILMTGGELYMQGGLIKGNDAQYGAGIAVMGGTCTIEGGTITGGIATQGGGVYVGPDGILSVVGGTLGSNNADFGAGIYNAGGEVTLSGGVVSDNSASFDGGGVYADGGDVSLADGAVLEKNRASESGGNLALGGDSNGVVFMDGGAINVQGELVMSGGTITGNGAVIGSGICFDCERWQTEKGRLAVSGSPLITENYLSWAARDKEDITIYMGHDADESARISVEGSFTPVKPPLVEKIYRGGWEYVALVDPGDYEMDAFACGQDRVNGNTDYVLVKRDDVLYAYLHTHSWETHTDERYPNRVTLTCTHASCPNFLHEAVLRLETEGLWDRQTELVYDGCTHAAYMGKVDVPLDLRYDVAYSYYEGTSVSGNPLKEPPSEIGTYTAEARLEVAGSTVYLTRTFSIRSVNNEMDANQMGHDETTEPIAGGGSGGTAARTTGTSAGAGASQKPKEPSTWQLPQTSDAPIAGMPALVLVGVLSLLVGIRQRRSDNH